MKCLHKFVFIACMCLSAAGQAQSEKEQLIHGQTDTVKNKAQPGTPSGTDTLRVKKKKHSPRLATFRSAVLPGWGQVYNGEYWKIPFVYAAIGIPAGFYIYNDTWYKRTRNAYIIRVNNDTAHFADIDKKLQGLRPESLQYYRNQFRKNKDYSILYTLIAWGLNVADATVFGHLKDFDVSDDLSLRLQPGYSPIGGTTGISLVLAVKPPAAHQFYRY